MSAKYTLLRCIVLIAFAIIKGSLAQDNDTQIASFLQASLSDLSTKLNDDPSGKSVDTAISTRKIYDRIWLFLAESNYRDAVGPYPERQRRVALIEEALTPFQNTLLKALIGLSQEPQPGNRLLNILGFSRPNAKMKSTVNDIVQSPKSSISGIEQAYDMLFYAHLDDPSDRQAIIAWARRDRERSMKADLAANLINAAASKWAMEDMKVMYREWLSIPYEEANIPEGRGLSSLAYHYAHAAAGLKAFGTSGSEFLPLLRQRLAELSRRSDDASKEVASNVQQAIDVVEDKAMPTQCGNDKGEYVGISQKVIPAWKATHAESSSTSNHPSDRSASPPLTNGPIKPAPSSTSSSAKKTNTPNTDQSDQTPWAILGVIIAAATGLLWLMFERRAK